MLVLARKRSSTSALVPPSICPWSDLNSFLFGPISLLPCVQDSLLMTADGSFLVTADDNLLMTAVGT